MKNSLISGLACLAAVPLLVLGVAACSSSDDSASSSKTSKAVSAHAWDISLASCMRAAGQDFPDPKEGEPQGIHVTADMDMESFQNDYGTCTKTTTKKLGDRPVSAAEKKMQEEGTKKAKQGNDCLRKKGYEVEDGKAGKSPTITKADGPGSIPEEALKECGLLSEDGSTGSTGH